MALAVPNPKALAVPAAIIKSDPDHNMTAEEIEQSIRQILSRAVASEEVIDIFKAAGLKKPDISILSDEFLAEVAGMPQRNLAVELLRNDEIKLRAMARRTLRRYGYPPDKQEKATETVLEQAELLAKDWAE